MKKLLAVVLCLLVIGSVAVGEKMEVSIPDGIDPKAVSDFREYIKTLSDDELEYMFSIFYNEMTDRGNSKETAVESIFSNSQYGPWYDYGLGQYVPNAAEVFGRELPNPSTFCNEDDKFSFVIKDGVTEEEYETYIEALKECGYNNDISELMTTFRAMSIYGIEAYVYFQRGYFWVDITKMK